MAKANIDTVKGTKITVEGTAEEVAAVIAHVQSRERIMEIRKQFVEERVKKAGKSTSLSNLILKLKEEGIFDKPHTAIEVKNALDQQAHFYPLPSVSTALIRKVQRSELGRIKVGDAWAYVKR